MKQIASYNYLSDGEKTVQTIDQGAPVVPNTLKIVTECRTIVNASPALPFAKHRFSRNLTKQRVRYQPAATPISPLQLDRLQSGDCLLFSPPPTSLPPW